MADPNLNARNHNSNHIKAIRHFWRPESGNPDLSRPYQLPPFAGVDSFDGSAEIGAPPSFDLHKCDLFAAPHDQIEVAMAASEAMGDELPAVAHEPPRGDAFTKKPKCLSLLRHALTVAPSIAIIFTRIAHVVRFDCT